MKLIEKKCPNCGSSLKFKHGDKDVTCEYCNNTYEIKDDEPVKVNPEIAFAGLAAFGFMSIIPVVLFFIVFVAILFFGFKMANDATDWDHEVKQEQVENDDNILDIIIKQKEESKKYYLTELEQFNDGILNKMYTNSMEDLNFYKTSSHSSNNWERVGYYLLVSEDDNAKERNIIFDIYKMNYSGNTRYGAVKYTNLKKSNTDHDYFGTAYCPTEFAPNGNGFIYGYKSIEELYDQLVKGDVYGYIVKGTSGLYIEN